MLATTLALLFAWTPQEPAAAAPTIPRGAELAALVKRLPPVGCESSWDETAKEWTPFPDVALMRRCVEERALDDEHWQAAILGTGVLRWREKWPGDQPFVISMREGAWMGLGKISMTPRIAGWKPAEVGETYYGSCGTYSGWVEQAALYQPLGSLNETIREVVFDVVVERGRSWMQDFRVESKDKPSSTGAKDPVLWRGALRIPVRAVASVDDVVPPVDSAELRAAVRASFGAGVRSWYIDERMQWTTYITLDPGAAELAALRDVALSLEVSVVHDGKTLETVHMYGSDGDRILASNSAADACGHFYASANLRTVPTDVARTTAAAWSLRVRGTSDSVLALWGRNRHWAGEVSIDLDAAISQEKVKAGPEGRGPEISTPR